MGNRLAGKVALITGGAGGCGLAASELFAAEGAKVGIVDLPKSPGASIAENMRAQGLDVVFVAADVSDEEQVNNAVDSVSESLGVIDILFNHAGTIVVKPLIETSVEEWDRLMAINVRSMFLMTKAVLPQMIKAGGGNIVCTSSISAVVATPNEVLYNTTKGACHMFARAVAVEYREQNIRCNAVSPGFIKTAHGEHEIEMLSNLGVDVSEDEIRYQQGRLCRPDEVAKAALFLVSDEASFINGTHLFVDNCYTAV